MCDQVEKIPRGGDPGRSGRVAYVLNDEAMPAPAGDFQWVLDSSFNIADELTHDPSKAHFYRLALSQGFAISETHSGLSVFFC